MFDRELSGDEIEELLSEKKSKAEYEIPGTTRKKKYNLEVRTITNWFKLPHTTGYCTVPGHVEHRKENDYPKDRIAMVVQIGRYMVCRWCFLERLDQQTSEPDKGGTIEGV